MAVPDLVQVTSSIGRAGVSGFPLSPTTFRYALWSFWVCLGKDGIARSIVWECANNFFAHNFNLGHIQVDLLAGLSNQWYSGIYNHNFVGPVTNIQVSVDGVAGIVQVYANDAPLSLTSGGLTGTSAPGAFNMTDFWAQWDMTGSGPPPGPGIGDVYVAAPAAFFDLSVTANRRKFQNADLSPVDLGATGSSVLGTVPQIYLTARGSDPTHFRINNGFGGAFTGTDPPLLPADTCTIPWPTGGGGGGGGIAQLAMDNVVVTATASLLDVNLISLRWSDDRGHSWGSPVTQDIGEAGEYRTSLQWQRLAYARDRVFEISWSVPMRTALQGCWVDVTPAQS